jgi:hypothetical protein
MYFINKYTVRLNSEKNPDCDRIHTFYIHKGSGVTLREAFNLLQGRSVNKDLTNMDGQKYTAWMQLNLREKDEFNNFLVNKFRERYGYNLEKALEKYPIRELRNEEQRVSLIKQLKKGNQCLATFEKRAKTEKMFIEANPRLKTINIYPIRSKHSLEQKDDN